MDDLPAFPVHDLPNFWGGAADPARDVTTKLDTERTHKRRGRRRELIDARRIENAAKSLGRLPDEGETFHIIMAGNFNAWDLVPAVLALSAPVCVRWLGLATLGFNREGVDSLTAMLDARQVEAVDFVCSAYFRSVDADVFDYLTTAMRARRQRVVAIRSHCKLILCEMTDGRCFAAESSANLRSCRNLEQLTIFHDRGLLEFHRGWMQEVIANAGTTPHADRSPQGKGKLAGKRKRG